MADTKRVRTFDLFCGAGGSSLGARLAGAEVTAGVDIDEVAEPTFQENFPGALFYRMRAEVLDLSHVAKQVGKIDLLLASPECTNHTNAKGGGNRSDESRMTAFQVVRYAAALRPRWIVVENVTQMRNWKRYEEFLSDLKDCGYSSAEFVLNAADFGVPQSRRRLFIVCDNEDDPPREIRHPQGVRRKLAMKFLNFDGAYPFAPLRKPGRAPATLQRANRAIRKLGREEPFLLVYYSTDGAGGWQRVDAPLRTVTTLDRFALVKREGRRHFMRMLQVPELKAAMGFDADFRFGHGTRRDKIRLLGNAVCPPVMKAIVLATTSSGV